MFVSSQGSAHARFRQALKTGNPTIASAAAAELGRLSLADALGLCLLYRDSDPVRFRRAAVRWHGRLCLEVKGLAPADAELAFAAVRGLGDGRAFASARALEEVLGAYGESQAARVLEEWIAQSR
jgi:hypothetical protein